MIFCFSNISLCFAAEIEKTVFFDDVVITDIQGLERISTYGMNPPATDFNLSNASYSGPVDFCTAVYTNRRFTGHNGRIHVYTDFDSDTIVSNPYITVKIMYNSITGDKVVASKTVLVNTLDEVTFTGLSTTKKYYIQFVNPVSQQSDYITGSFTVTN